MGMGDPGVRGGQVNRERILGRKVFFPGNGMYPFIQLINSCCVKGCNRKENSAGNA
jgi:hypothetical protein